MKMSKLFMPFALLILMSGCMPKEFNPDIRPCLDAIHADASYDEVYDVLGKEFKVKRLSYKKGQPISRIIAVPSAKEDDLYYSALRVVKYGQEWSYEVYFYFDSQGQLLGVNYWMITPHPFSEVSPNSWSPKW